jgi:hypothetical protein
MSLIAANWHSRATGGGILSLVPSPLAIILLMCVNTRVQIIIKNQSFNA